MTIALTAAPKLIVGNWKMNGLRASSAELEALAQGLATRVAASTLGAGVALCPPATLLQGFAERARDVALEIGAQTCHPEPSGARTGEISAEMIKDAGAALVLVGHSERRAMGETDADVRARAEAAWRAGLLAIGCVGETAAERDAGRALEVVGAQLAASLPDAASDANAVVAYEPVWAIGSGRTPSPAEIEEVHAAARAALSSRFGAPGDRIKLLYGGSVSPANAAEILATPGVDGALVGGARLRAASFLSIVDAAAPVSA